MSLPENGLFIGESYNSYKLFHKFFNQRNIILLYLFWRGGVSAGKMKYLGILLPEQRFIMGQVVVFAKQSPDPVLIGGGEALPQMKTGCG